MAYYLEAVRFWKWAGCIGFVLALVGVCRADDRPPISELSTSRTHIGFVPGDAFFSIRIKDDFSFLGEISSEGDTPSIELDYRFPDVQPVPSPQDYLGFSRLKIVGVTSQDCDTLNRFRDLLWAEQQMIDMDRGYVPWWGTLESKPMVSIVIVNRDFDWRVNHFYIRYNEKWNNERPNLWPGKVDPVDHKKIWPRRYQPHVVTAESVLEDWTGGDRVAPLRVRLPESVTYKVTDLSGSVVEPVEMTFEDIAVIGFPTSDLQTVFSRPLNSTFFVATSDGVSRFRWILEEGVEKVLREEKLFKPEEDPANDAPGL